MSSSFSSPSGLAHVFIVKSGVDKPIGILTTEEKINTISERNASDMYQLTPIVHITPKDISLNKKGTIDFDINSYIEGDHGHRNMYTVVTEPQKEIANIHRRIETWKEKYEDDLSLKQRYWVIKEDSNFWYLFLFNL